MILNRDRSRRNIKDWETLKNIFVHKNYHSFPFAKWWDEGRTIFWLSIFEKIFMTIRYSQINKRVLFRATELFRYYSRNSLKKVG